MFTFVAQLFAFNLVATYWVINWLFIKITDRIIKGFSLDAELEQPVHKKFAGEVEEEQVVMVVIGVARVDRVAILARIDVHVDWVDNVIYIQIGIALDRS